MSKTKSKTDTKKDNSNLNQKSNSSQEEQLTWREKLKKTPPSNSLLKINIICTLIFSIITTGLALMTYLSYTKIQGMEEVIGSFRARVKLKPDRVRITPDTVFINATLKNYGVRSATDVTSYIYIATKELLCAQQKTVTLFELDPNETYPGEIPFERLFKGQVPYVQVSDSELKDFSLAIKTVYTDAVTAKTDSSYYYGVNQSGISENVIFRTASKEEIMQIKRTINNVLHINI